MYMYRQTRENCGLQFNEVLLELFSYYSCNCCDHYRNRNRGYTTKSTVVSYPDLRFLNAWVKLAHYYQENGHAHPNKMPNHRRIDVN